MDTAPSRASLETNAEEPAAATLAALVRSQLEHAVDGVRRGLKVYESLRNLDEVIGTQYGDRVLYELIQNAHDAHAVGERGKIAIKLVVNSPTDGLLYVANGGSGFALENVDAIRNLATSSKEVGEGIGNKGLGFRSVEALTDDVHIYSQRGADRSDHFGGFCFRFAGEAEIEALLEAIPDSQSVRRKVANTIPRYLVSVPLTDQPSEVVSFARSGYATVIVIPLRTPETVTLATGQVRSLAELEVPLLLFLDRIAEVRIDIDLPDQTPVRRSLRRQQEYLSKVDGIERCSLHRIDVGEQRRFLVVRRQVDKTRVLEAVEKSIPAAPQLRRWLNWKGEPAISVAVSLNRDGIATGRLYNFLPMGPTAVAPLGGFLDAPFFTDIDRRTAKTDLPLNDGLITAAAEACAAAAITIVEKQLHIPPQSVFDLIAWGSPHTAKIEGALKLLGTSLRTAKIIPVLPANARDSWTSLAEASLWPAGRYSVLKPRDVARYVGAALVPPQLGELRIQRLKHLAGAIYRILTPSPDRLGPWLETFALALFERKVGPRVWADFYEDVKLVFDSVGADLKSLAGRRILIDRAGKMRPAVTGDTDAQRQVYVRGDSATRARSAAGVPLPPQSLSRRYFFLDDRVLLKQETVLAFVKAGLLRPYDPIEALAGLSSALGRQASESRRRDALLWAFQVWKAAGSRVEDALKKADLHVPVRSGWRSAAAAAFSASWTSIGVVLENYLAEAGAVSADCRRAADGLLISHADWPSSSQDSKRDWRSFLDAIGVADGLRPTPAATTRRGNPASTWNPLLRHGAGNQGFDSDWCNEVKAIGFNYPYTDYEMEGEAWRLPGQLEHGQLSESAKEAFSNLIFEHLKVHGGSYFQFKVGRFERSRRDWDERVLPTPLAVFVRTKSWIAANSRDGVAFCAPSKCWSARIRRDGPPRFIDRVSEERAVDFAESNEFSTLVFGNAVGIRDWQSETTASDRLADLATVAVDVPSSDRARFRKEYQRAWLDVGRTKARLPKDLSIVVTRRGHTDVIIGSSECPPELIVTKDLGRFEAKVLSAAGRAVLDIGEAPLEEVVELLDAAATFAPLRLDGVRIQLLVDGEVFAPRTTDPLLISSGLEWLPDVVAIGHELLAERLEKGIARTTLEARVRSIRLRRCERISLVVDGGELASQEGAQFYAFEHGEAPTFILSKGVSLDWKTLVGAADAISRLIDSRLRSFEILLLRLGSGRVTEGLEAPSEDELALALRTDAHTVREQILALRTDNNRVLHMLLPVVAVLGGLDLAKRLQADAERLGSRFDVKGYLEDHLGAAAKQPTEIVNACEQSGDRAELRRLLGLDYQMFNEALVGLGEAPLSNEAELRRLYDAYLREMKPDVVDKLRRYYFSEYERAGPLDEYLERKTLAFLKFDESWIVTRETLGREVVETHVGRIMNETLGDDVDVNLQPLGRLVDANRKTAHQVVKDVSPLVTVWCRTHGVAIPSPWEMDDPQAVARFLENKGLFDFELFAADRIPSVCQRAGCWPPGMMETTNRLALGLAESDLQDEERRREEERKRAEVARRTIVFGDTPLDTGANDFTDRFLEIAERSLGSDASWYEKSRQRVRLETFSAPESSRLGSETGGAQGGRRRRERQLTVAQRQAMGLAGEWLAYQFLRKRHAGYVDEDNWVSENRQRFFGGGPGDDGAGYDFRVETPQAEWLYEVKSSLEDSGEFELTANELRVASGAAKDGRRRYRILYVPHVLSPHDWCILELPNPMGERTRNQFQTIGRGSVRMRFKRR